MYPQFAALLARPVALLFAFLFALCFSAFAAAQAPGSGHAGSLAVSDAWARATPPAARTGAVYLTLVNEGAEPDRLTAATTSAAARVEIHTHIMEGGIARMRQIDAVEISPGAPAVFQPGGLHLMLIDLRGALRDGDSLALTLTFARAGTMTLDVPIRRTAPTGQPPAAAPHRH